MNKEKEYKILFAEDQPLDVEMADRSLKKNGIKYVGKRVETEADFIQALEEFDPDIVISDYSMPEFDGMRALEIVVTTRPEIPVIIFTGSINEETAVECMKSGATDYILKDHITRLPFAVTEAIKKSVVEKEKRTAIESLRIKTLESENNLARLQRAEKIAGMGFMEIFSAENTVVLSEEAIQLLDIDILSDKYDIESTLKNVFPADREILTSSIQNAIHNKEEIDFIFRVKRSNSELSWLRAESEKNQFESNKIKKILCTISDITVIKESEIKLDHLNKVLHALRNINQIITHETSPLEIIQLACNALAKTRGYKAAWIVLFDTNKHIRHFAVSEYGKISTILQKFSDDKELPYCMTKALSKRDAVLVENETENCLNCPISKELPEEQILAQRLEYKKTVYGVLTVAIPVDIEISEEEISLFNEVCGDIAYSLYNIEVEAQRNLALDQLEESEERYKALYEGNHSVMLLINPENDKIVDANNAACRFYGWSFDQLTNMQMKEINNLSDHEFKNVLAGSVAQKNNLFYFKHTIASGEIRDVEVHSGPIKIKGKTLLYSIVHDVTERRLAQDALKESEQKLRNIVEHSTNMFYTHTPEHEITYMSPQVINILGFTQAEIKRKWTELTTDNPINEIGYQYTVKAIETGKPQQSYELELLHKSGKKVWVEVREAPVVQDGKTSAIVGALVDITERKVNEREINTLAHAIKSINDCVSVSDLDNNLIFANKALLNAFGYTLDDIIGKSAEVFGSKRNPENLHKQILKDTINGGWQGELWNKRKDGSEFPIYLSTSTIKDENGDSIALVGVFNDITEQKHSELLQSIILNISQAANTDIYLNQLIEIIKVELQKIIDIKNFFVAFYDEITDIFTTPYTVDDKDPSILTWAAGKSLSAFVLKNRKPILLTKDEIFALAKDGDVEIIGTVAEIWMGVPLIVKGKPFGVFAIQNYENGEAYNQKDLEVLEFVSHQMSISFERKRVEKELLMAKEKAEESDRLKSAFLATMSHELRTPLNAVIGFSDLMKEKLTLEKFLDFAGIINRSGRHLLEIVEDIFDVTLLEVGQVNLAKELHSLSTVMRSVNEMVEAEQLKLDRKVKIIYKPAMDEKDVTIYTDKAKFKQIMINLLKNAIKFTHEGLIEYGYEKIDEKGKLYLRFYVKDTGIGIAKDKQEIIFSIFRQVDESLTRFYGGTGIGLFVVKRFTEILGGKVELESEEGKGSIFFISLPYNEPVK